MLKLVLAGVFALALLQAMTTASAQEKVDSQKAEEIKKEDSLPPATGKAPSDQAGAQEPSSKVKGMSDDTAIFVDGRLTVPGAPADSETVPSTVSARNAASDKLPIAAFRLKHLTDAQRREIAQEIGQQRVQAIGPAGTSAQYVVGSQVPAPVALQELAPLPEALIAKLPELRGTGFMHAGSKLLLVDLDNSLVVGVLDR
jgi:hypothetical protein